MLDHWLIGKWSAVVHYGLTGNCRSHVCKADAMDEGRECLEISRSECEKNELYRQDK